MNWHIGQKVVSLKTWSDKRVPIKEGDIFTIKGIASVCKCDGKLHLDVGLKNDCGTYCSVCGAETSPPITWAYDGLFAPLDEMNEAEKAVKELLEPQYQKL